MNRLHEYNWPLVIAMVLFGMGLFAVLYLIGNEQYAGPSDSRLGIYE